jgi:hypothetical protein
MPSILKNINCNFLILHSLKSYENLQTINTKAHKLSNVANYICCQNYINKNSILNYFKYYSIVFQLYLEYCTALFCNLIQKNVEKFLFFRKFKA